MPLYQGAIDAICEHLAKIAKGEKPGIIAIGEITAEQHESINAHRAAANHPPLISREVVYLGRHHHESRSKDGYSIPDMAIQLQSGLSDSSLVYAKGSMMGLRASTFRDDGYGNRVRDLVILEFTQRKPRVEAFSAIPKGDGGGPKNKKPL